MRQDHYLLIGILITAVIGPLITSWFTWRRQRADKAEDWRRQNEVASRLLASQTAVAERLMANHDDLTNRLNSNSQKLDGITSRVDGSLTLAMENELGALERELAMLKELMSLKRSLGVEPSKESYEMFETAVSRIEMLKQNIVERKRVDMALEEEEAAKEATS